jgi:transcriptional regulator with XRE-family HTH domain
LDIHSNEPRTTATDAEETLGQRIRRLRHERGMTLAQVAGQDFTRAFLNQVEMGRSMPSTRLLRVIASRLGAPVDYLVDGSVRVLDLELAVERARLALLQGNPRRALSLVEPARLERMALGSDARLCAAEALIALDRRDEALKLLAAEEPLLRRQGDRDRLRRLRAVRAGRRTARNAASHIRLADRAMREGQREQALEHYRTARILRESAGDTSTTEEDDSSEEE